MENVSTAKKSNTYKAAREKLKESGYGLTEIVLDASLYGVPQKGKDFSASVMIKIMIIFVR